MEELIAELGAAFLCAELLVSRTPRPDHAHYLKDWLEVLRSDKTAIFAAASQASRAVEYLRGLQDGQKALQRTVDIRGQEQGRLASARNTEGPALPPDVRLRVS